MTDPIPDDEIPADEVLPCGCVLRYAIVNDTRTMTVIPCRTTCKNYRAMLGIAAEEGTPIVYRRGT